MKYFSWICWLYCFAKLRCSVMECRFLKLIMLDFFEAQFGHCRLKEDNIHISVPNYRIPLATVFAVVLQWNFLFDIFSTLNPIYFVRCSWLISGTQQTQVPCAPRPVMRIDFDKGLDRVPSSFDDETLLRMSA